ncbi:MULTISPECIES: hypothetical protein [Pontibacillus]|uniref:Uncharacterized protein n=1 Tax=Pontibacillus chungwhensis TaxID=265426 RepID=A0ABY8V1P8_9BACI|nr:MULTISPECIES: hypothetical protein [Pontibacillus]WIF99373.1 hypothetical protein QNI29_06865 [Pontibacillus chungwhensis]
MNDLYKNPYIVLSEAVQYFVDKILASFSNRIPYEKLYGAMLNFVQVPKSQLYTEDDLYGTFINHLIDNPYEKDCLPMYIDLFMCLFNVLNDNGYYIDDEWREWFYSSFKKHFYKVVSKEPKYTLEIPGSQNNALLHLC